MQQIEATFFIADKLLNNFMGACALKPDHKCFVNRIEKVRFSTTTEVDDKYFIGLIEKSLKNSEKFWIPVIKYMGKIYLHPGIKEVSNGQKIIFIKGMKND